MSLNSIFEKTKFCFRITANIGEGTKLLGWTFVLVFYSRYFSAQLKSNKKVKSLDIKTHQGPYNIHLRLQDISVFYEIFFSNVYDIADMNLPKGAVVDIGAHIGLASLYFWENGLRHSTFYCVEPSIEHLELLKYNIRSLDCTLINAGISDHNGIDELDTSGYGYNFKIGSDGQVGERVDICTMDRLFESYDIGKVALLKINIEGEEIKIFKHKKEWLKKVSHLFVEVHGEYGSDELLFDLGRGDELRFLFRDIKESQIQFLSVKGL